MADDLPSSHPNVRGPPRVTRPGRHVWTLAKGDQILRCELRDDSQAGGSWDLLLFDGHGLLSRFRRATEADARASAEDIKQSHLCDGWIEAKGAPLD